jgi:hypothetical protein
MAGYYDNNETNFVGMCTTMKVNNSGFISDFNTTFVGGLDLGLQNAEQFYRNLVKAIGDKDDETTFMGKIHSAQEAWRF